ncbi:MAG: hypothetical protein Tsb005_21370 [Gammaproteobacteria bacterium]
MDLKILKTIVCGLEYYVDEEMPPKVERARRSWSNVTPSPQNPHTEKWENQESSISI